MSWILIIIVLIALFIFVKATNRGQNWWSYLIVFGVIFLLITIVYVSTFSGVSFKNFDGILDFGKLYFTWLGKIIGNFGRITGNAINMDWSVNSTAK